MHRSSDTIATIAALAKAYANAFEGLVTVFRVTAYGPTPLLQEAVLIFFSPSRRDPIGFARPSGMAPITRGI
jgi:hypothetical protein